MIFYVGSFAAMGGQGITQCRLDGNDLTTLRVLEELESPNYVLLSADKKTLFAVGGVEKTGLAASFDVSGETPRLLSRIEAGGQEPCFLALSKDERFLYTANYFGDSLSALRVEENRITQLVEVTRHEGHGVNLYRQDRPHPHQVTFSPADDTLLHSVDLGLDAVISYRQDAATGLLTRAFACFTGEGRGPRHLCHVKGGAVAYLAHELSSEVSLLRYQNGRFSLGQTLSTLPSDFAGASSCAAIRAMNGFVYVSNRGHDSICVFTIAPNDTLSSPRWIGAAGKTPRDFQVLPDGRLLVANQDSGQVVLLSSDGTVLSKLDVPGAVCIAF